MGFLTKPSIKQVDPNPRSVRPLQNDISKFLMDVYGGNNPFASQTSELQRMATGGIQQFLSQPSPEQQTFDLLRDNLMGLATEGTAGQITNAALPIFEQNLQRQLGGASNASQGRFSSAFAGQGIDLASRAAQDFNLFQQQALQADVQNRLGAAGVLGTLGASAGNAQGRMLDAGRLGLDMTNSSNEMLLRLMLGGMGFAQPQALDTIVGSSPLDNILNAGTSLLTGRMLMGGGGGSAAQNAVNSGLRVAPPLFGEPDPNLVLGNNNAALLRLLMPGG